MRLVRVIILGIATFAAMLWLRSTVAADTLTATLQWPGTLQVLSNTGYVRVIASPVRGNGWCSIDWKRSDHTGFT